jgi:hypothetical protein
MNRILLFTFLLLSFVGFGQTGIIEDFNDNDLASGWKAVTASNFTLTETNQELKVQATNAGSSFSNIEFSFPTQDIVANPTIQLKIKNASSFTLRIDVVDTDGTSSNASLVEKVISASANNYVNHILNFSGKFGAANSSKIHKVVIFLNAGQHPGFTGTIYIDDLIIGDAIQPKTYGPIKINQVGYELNGPKIAVLEKTSNTNTTTIFEVINTQNTVVHSGNLISKGMVAGWTGRYFWNADFSEFNTPGIYSIKIGNQVSREFEIKENLLFDKTISNAVSFFKNMRHTGEADKSLSFNGPRNDKANVFGGWWDATGDPGKHFSHLSYSNYFNPQQIPFVVWSLLKSYDLNGFESVTLENNIKEEAAWGADYLLRNLDPAGYFYTAIFDSWGNDPSNREICEWGADGHDGARSANYQCAFREGGGVAIAALARAYYMDIAGDSSKTQYLNGAIRAYQHLTSPGTNAATKSIEYTNNQQENIIDDYCALLAATELYKATRENQYLADAQLRVENLLARMNSAGWLESDHAGQRPFFHAADEGMPILSLLNYMDIDQSKNSSIQNFINKSINWYKSISEEASNPFNYLKQYNRSYDDGQLGAFRKSFFIPHNNETGYWWQGENARLASMSTALLLSEKHINKSYKLGSDQTSTYSIGQLDWILGKNPFEICMMHGYGYQNYPDYPSGAGLANIVGGICNGISADDNDEDNLAWKPYSNDSWQNWRWVEQWLPHNAWYVLAVSSINYINNNPDLAVSEFGTIDLLAGNGTVQIDWTTLSEVNGDFFRILKSSNAGPFVEIGTLQAEGGIDQVADYTFTDNSPGSGNDVYKVQLIDKKWNITNSEEKSLMITNTLGFGTVQNFIIYPNPFNGEAIISINDPSQDTYISIKDLSGKEVERHANFSGKSIQIGASLTPGIYFIEVLSKGNRTTHKLIKSK